MRDYYKIESVLLDDISRNINSEKTSFMQGTHKTFSNSYLKTCSDTCIKLMSSHIEELYSKINSGYNSLSTWLTDYTNDAKNVEKGLSSSGYNVIDFYTNMTLKATLNHKDVDINKSPDVIDGLNNSNKTNYPYIVNGTTDSSYEPLPYTIGDDSKEKVALYNETVSLSGKKYDERGFEINEVVEVDYDELISQKQQLLASLNTIKEELKKEEAELIEKRSELVEVLKNNSPTRAKPYGNAEYQEASEKYKEYSKQLSEIQATITLVEMYAKQTQDEIDLTPYDELKDTTEFKNFRDNYNRTEAYEIKDALETGKNQYDALADYEKNGSGGYVFKLVEGDFETEVTVEDFSRYATEDEKMVYHYLAATKGEQTANQYLIKLVDNINMMKGAELANAKLYDIRTTIEEEENADSAIEAAWMGLSNTFQSWGLGLIDGTDNFINGFANWFSRDKHMSAEQYATIITAQYLTQHKYGTSYEIGNVTGNMLPALAISVVTRAGLLGLALPAEVAGLYAEVLGTTMMGLSAGGNAKVNAMQNLGANPTSALLYGFLIGSSESLLGRYLGNIPGLSQEAGFTLAGILREGLEEASQDAFAAVVEAIMYGKPINLDELTDDMTKSFLMGVLMSFGTTGVTTVISMKIDGLDYEIKGEDLLKAAEILLKDNRGSINLAAFKDFFKKNGAVLKVEETIEPFELNSETINNYKNIHDILFPEDFKYDMGYSYLFMDNPQRAAEVLANRYGGTKELYLYYIDLYNDIKTSVVDRLRSLGYNEGDIGLIISEASSGTLNTLLNSPRNKDILQELYNNLSNKVKNSTGNLKATSILSAYITYSKFEASLDEAINSSKNGKKQKNSLKYLKENGVLKHDAGEYFVFDFNGYEIKYPKNMKSGYNIETYLSSIEDVMNNHPSIQGKFKTIIFNSTQNGDFKNTIMATDSADTDNGKLYIYPISNTYMDDVVSNIVHEGTHGIDKENIYSSSAEYHAAAAADNNYTSSYGKDYAEQNGGSLQEDFAEAAAYLEKNGRTKFEQKFPNRANYFKKYLSNYYYEFKE